MAQDSVLSLDSFERRYFDTNDTIETVLTDAYFNKWKRELEVNEMLTVRIGQERHIIRITQIDPFVKSVRSPDTYIDSRIAALETGTTPPDPDPAPVFWNTTLDVDRLYPNQYVTGYTGTHWAVTIDTTDQPTYPDDYTEGNIPSVSPDPLVYGVPETRRLWQYDTVTTNHTEILAEDESSGITLTPVDTRPEVWVDPAFSIAANGSNPNSQIDWSIDTVPVDPTPGSGHSHYNILDDATDGTLVVNTTDTSGTINVAPGFYNLYAQAVDVAGNISESNRSSVTIDPTTVGTVGWTSITQTEAESGGVFNVSLTRVGTGAFSIYVSTYDDTAVGDTHFTAIDSDEVAFGAGETTKNVSVTPINTSATLDNQFFLHIDWDNRGGGVSVTRETTSITLDGSGSTGIIGYQQEVSADDLVVFDLDSSNSTIVPATKSGREGETYNQLSDTGRSANDLMMWPGVAGDWGTSTFIDIEGPHISTLINFTSTGDHFLHARGINRTSTTGQVGHWTILRGVTSIEVDDSGAGGGGTGFQLVTLAGNHGWDATNGGRKVFFEGTDVSDYHAAAGFDVTSASGDTFEIANTGFGAASGGSAFGDATLLGLKHTQAASGRRLWESTDGTDAREMSIPAVGQYEVRLYPNDYQNSIDKALFTTNGSYDPDIDDSGDSTQPTIDEAFGPVVSDYQLTGGSGGGLNPENRTDYPVPIPTATVVPDSRNPANGATNVIGTVPIYIQFDSATGMELNHFKVLNAADDPIVGTYTVDQQFAFHIQTNPLPDNSAFSCDIEGRIVDSDGEMKSISTAPWAFDTTDPAGTIIDWDFNQYDVGHVINQEDIAAIFGNTNTNGTINAGNCTIVADPLGQRGNVLAIQFYAGIYGVGGGQARLSGVSHSYDFSDVGVSPQSDVYVAYDAMVGPPSNSWIWNWGTHLHGIGAGEYEEVDGNNQITNSHQYYSSGAFPNRPDGSLACYSYHSTSNQQSSFWNDADPTLWSSSSDATNQTIWTRGAWHSKEFHCGMNTFSSNVGQADGILEAWHNGQLVLYRDSVIWGSTDLPNTPLFDRGTFKTWVGGSTTDWAMAQDQVMFIANFRVSTSRITG